MTHHLWSFTLQWSRFGINALVFLCAARFLTLEDLGLFATAYAPIKLLQSLHKTGIAETVVIKAPTATRLNTLFAIALVCGGVLSISFLLFCSFFDISWSLTSLGAIPFILGFSCVSDGLLRKHMRIKALAIRTALAQICAAIATFALLLHGSGKEALVLFVLSSTGMASVLSILMARWRPSGLPRRGMIAKPLKTVFQLAGRDMVHSSILPLAQIAIAWRFGMIEAGAFQIAQRALSMFDALTLAPLRLLALPQFKTTKNQHRLNLAIQNSFQISLWIAGWVWFGLASSTTAVLSIAVGPVHALSSTAHLQALIPLGLSAAISMPFTQGLAARGQTRFIFLRAIALFLCSVCFAMPMFFISGLWVCIALSCANFCILIWFLRQARHRLDLKLEVIKITLLPLIAGILMFALVLYLDFALFAEIIIGSLLYGSLLFFSPLKPHRRNFT